MQINYEIIGVRVKEARLKNNISQAGLAERIDMSVSYISRIETAKKQASLEALVRIANVLGVTVDHLLGGNQTYDLVECLADLISLLEGCTLYEKRLILDIASATKTSLLENRWLRRNEVF